MTFIKLDQKKHSNACEQLDNCKDTLDFAIKNVNKSQLNPFEKAAITKLLEAATGLADLAWHNIDQGDDECECELKAVQTLN